MDGNVTVQNASDSEPPSPGRLSAWATAAMQQAGVEGAGITIRLVGPAESRALNLQYRQVDRETNVLSFPFEDPPGVESNYLGDLAICAEVVDREALGFGVERESRWAHMVIHGVLHLAGYDHQGEAQAREMEALETAVLTALGYADPWAGEEPAGSAA